MSRQLSLRKCAVCETQKHADAFSFSDTRCDACVVAEVGDTHEALWRVRIVERKETPRTDSWHIGPTAETLAHWRKVVA